MPRVLFVNATGNQTVSPPNFADTTQVIEAHSTGTAIELLSQHSFDGLYLCESEQSTNLLHRILQSDSILHCVPMGLALLDSQKRIIRASTRLAEWLSMTDLAGLYFDDCIAKTTISGSYANPLNSAIASKTACEAELQIGDRHFTMVVTPLLNLEGNCHQLVVTLQDSTERVTQKQKLKALHEAGSELTDLRPEEIYQMGFQDRVELLKDNIQHHTKDLLDLDVVEIRVLNAETLELKPLLSVGMDSGISQKTLFADTKNNGVTGFVAATGTSYLCEDTTADKQYVDGLVGAKSSLTVPLKYHDEIVGTFNVESPEVNRFNQTDLEFLESFGRYIAIALNTLELLNAQKTNATLESVDKIRDAVALPVDEILNHAVQVIESFIGQDPELIERLETIQEHARDIKESIKNVRNDLAPVAEVPTCVQTQRRPKLQNKRVLVVDADKNVRTSAHQLLERHGCTVETAHSGNEALMMVRRTRDRTQYDAFIIDIRLSDLRGYEVLKRLKEFYGDPPVILMTGFGYDSSHTIPKAREAGLRSNAMLYKPFRLEQLLDTLESTVEFDPQVLTRAK